MTTREIVRTVGYAIFLVFAVVRIWMILEPRETKLALLEEPDAGGFYNASYMTSTNFLRFDPAPYWESDLSCGNGATPVVTALPNKLLHVVCDAGIK